MIPEKAVMKRPELGKKHIRNRSHQNIEKFKKQTKLAANYIRNKKINFALNLTIKQRIAEYSGKKVKCLVQLSPC